MVAQNRRACDRFLRRLAIVWALLGFQATQADDRPTTAKAATRPAATRPGAERNLERLTPIRAATLAALDYAKAHDGKIPTTEQLARHMRIAPNEFRYRVVPSGTLDRHMKRVEGDWPEVLIAEKRGGADGKWAFGFVDGMCSIESAASYKENENSAALRAIAEDVQRGQESFRK